MNTRETSAARVRRVFPLLAATLAAAVAIRAFAASPAGAADPWPRDGLTAAEYDAVGAVLRESGKLDDTIALHHVVQSENWPSMPLVASEFELRPFDFFDANPTAPEGARQSHGN